MNPRRSLAICGLLVLATARWAPAETAPISIAVDARDAPRKVLHARIEIPLRPGPRTLLYPKWIPGEHGPSGPIADLTGLRIEGGGRTIPWRRDPTDMFAFHVDVPEGVETISVALDLLSPAAEGSFSSGPSTTEALAVVSWNTLVLYPDGSSPDDLPVAATLRLPEGWKYGTALTTVRRGPDGIVFATTSLTTLIDSPVLAGSHFRVVDLGGDPIPHRLQIAADSEAALAMRPQEIASYRNLVAETGALFGARHYRHYDFLLTLSDHVAHFGLEHHESSDDRIEERGLVDEDSRLLDAGLLPHEMVHSWCGKYRRPAGLEPGRYDRPMRGDLLWVYEGLTEYLGQVLAARSGLLTPEQYRESLARIAAAMDAQKGRSWRPLADTAVSAQILFFSRADGASWRRGTDFYDESELLWLEADAIIRKETRGRRSLDDFCRLFFGPPSGPPAVVPYTFDDVISALQAVAPYDWRGFWTSRLDATTTRAPLGGLTATGWALAYRTTPTATGQSAEASDKSLDARFSIGFAVQDDGAIADVIPESPAARAGVAPGTKLLGVNGRRYTRDVLRDALTASPDRPIEILVEDGEFLLTYKLDYAAGQRYPRLERVEATPDVLSEILRPLSRSTAKGAS